MARVDWRVHATPIAQTAADAEGGSGLSTETMTLDVKGSVGAGNSSGAWAGNNIIEWAAGVHTLVNAKAAGANVSAASDNLVFIKNTGKVFDATVTTGNSVNLGSTDTDVDVKVKIYGSSDMFHLKAGEGVVIPQPQQVFSVYSVANDETCPAVEYLKLT